MPQRSRSWMKILTVAGESVAAALSALRIAAGLHDQEPLDGDEREVDTGHIHCSGA